MVRVADALRVALRSFIETILLPLARVVAITGLVCASHTILVDQPSTA